ncbi:MAG TPA: permease prefix domain 2-containing transporter, partial [Cyclobacteriaceae bacterium]
MSQEENTRPPKWPLRFLRFFVKKEYLEEIEGDMEEIFYNNVEQLSLKQAKRIYTVEMLKLLRPELIKNLKVIENVNPYPMFKNYFKTSFRSLVKNPLTSFINVFGLSVAIGICLVVYAFMEYDYSIDQFHKNKNEVYLTTFFANREGAIQQYGTTPRPLGDHLKEDFEQIKKVCRVEDKSVVVKRDDHVFHERIRYADPEFLELFTFPLKWGTAGALSDLNSVILSEDMSIKYFGEENPIGRDLLIIFDDKTKKEFTITGVAATFPKSRDIDFNFLINFRNTHVADSQYDLSDWSQFVNATLIQVENPSDVKLIERRMEKYRLLQNEAQPDWAISSFAFESLATLHEKSANIKDGIAHDYNVEGRIGMPIIAIFMLALACFNYINIAIVSAARRLKEIGVRKVIGANRFRVIIQFLTENIVVTFFALLIGLVLGIGVFIPWFVQFSGWDLEIKLLNENLWIFLCALLLFTGIASGIYPAFYISNFDAIKIFKGSLQFGRKNPMTKFFLGVQLVLACMTITAGVVFTQNNSYQNNRSWGYNQKETLYAIIPDYAAFDKLNAAMIQNPNVLSVSGSTDHLGKTISTAVIHMPPDRHYEVNQLSVDADYFET